MIAARRLVFVSGVVALCAWVLLPIYLIALGALGGRATVYQWPKSFLPTNVSWSALIRAPARSLRPSRTRHDRLEIVIV